MQLPSKKLTVKLITPIYQGDTKTYIHHRSEALKEAREYDQVEKLLDFAFTLEGDEKEIRSLLKSGKIYRAFQWGWFLISQDEQWIYDAETLEYLEVFYEAFLRMLRELDLEIDGAVLIPFKDPRFNTLLSLQSMREKILVEETKNPFEVADILRQSNRKAFNYLMSIVIKDFRRFSLDDCHLIAREANKKLKTEYSGFVIEILLCCLIVVYMDSPWQYLRETFKLYEE